jgi:hypothetical protein
MARRPHQKNTASLSGQGVGRGDATSSGLACQPEVRGPAHARRLAEQTRPSAVPLRAGRIGAGEVACLRATHRQVNDRLRREPLGLSSGRRLSRAVRRTTRGAGQPPGWRAGRAALGGSPLRWGGPGGRGFVASSAERLRRELSRAASSRAPRPELGTKAQPSGSAG